MEMKLKGNLVIGDQNISESSDQSNLGTPPAEHCVDTENIRSEWVEQDWFEKWNSDMGRILDILAMGIYSDIVSHFANSSDPEMINSFNGIEIDCNYNSSDPEISNSFDGNETLSYPIAKSSPISQTNPGGLVSEVVAAGTFLTPRLAQINLGVKNNEAVNARHTKSKMITKQVHEHSGADHCGNRYVNPTPSLQTMYHKKAVCEKGSLGASPSILKTERPKYPHDAAIPIISPAKKRNISEIKNHTTVKSDCCKSDTPKTFIGQECGMSPPVLLRSRLAIIHENAEHNSLPQVQAKISRARMQNDKEPRGYFCQQTKRRLFPNYPATMSLDRELVILIDKLG